MKMESPNSGVASPNYNRRNLYFAAFSVYLLFIAVGLVMGWSSPSIPKLRSENHNFTASQEALLSSITNLAPGPLLTIFGIDSIGRKWTLFIIWITTVICPLIMIFSQDFVPLLVARFIGGWGMGAAFSVIGIYISEIADVGVRGALNNVSLLSVSIGMIASFSIGPFVTFQHFSIVALILSSVFGLFWFLLPESPYHLVAKGKSVQAKSVLRNLRLDAAEEDILQELDVIKFGIEEERKNKSGLKKLFTSKAVYKQFAISFYLLYLQQGSGLAPLGAYSQDIFDAASLNFNGAYVPIAMGILTTVIMIPAPFILKKFGTKQLFILGGFGSGLGMAFLGVNFVCLNAGYDMSSVRYLPVALDFIIMLSVYCGLGGSIWGTVSELFSPSVKGAATGICGIFSTFMGFVATQAFGELKASYGFGPTFIAFGVLQTVISLGLFFVIDTSKMTLQEIQDYFEGRQITKSEKKFQES